MRTTSTTEGFHFYNDHLRYKSERTADRRDRRVSAHAPGAGLSRISEEKTPPNIPNVAPPHFCAHISLSPSPPSSPEKHGESPDPPPMAGTLPAAARAHITRCSSGLNLLNRRVVAVTMLMLPPHRLRMPIALRLANFQHPWQPRWLLQEVWLCTDPTPGAARR